jgi:hypothetical protein|tara:strand:+ start:302 stop:466 length:165 start_codon:yes stop_codon:yes gene_type:complete
MITYKITKSFELGTQTGLLRSDGTWIPIAPENKDYQEYLVWLEEGNEPLPEEAE